MAARNTHSMQDIADALGISRATVSNALRGKGRLSPETARLVRDKAAELNFVPSGVALALRTGRSAVIGLILPDFRMPLFADLAQAFAKAARARDMVLTVADCLGDPDEQRRHLTDLAARGLDVLAVVPIRGTRTGDLDVSCPLVVIDAATNPLNTISADHHDGARKIARHLLELGHRSVLILHAPGRPDGAEASRVNDLRLDGLREEFGAAGVNMQTVALDARFEAARDYISSWEPGSATAIAATYDALAVGALNALATRRIRVPEDISVSGFDDTVWGRITTPALTTIRQDLDALAEGAFASAFGAAPSGLLIPVSLVVRGSTGPAAMPPGTGRNQ